MTITSTSKDPPSDTEFGKLWTLEDTFTHPEFRLLYVPPKDEDDIMTIITPSKHESSYVPDRKFYALSHLWGTDPKDNLWEVSDFISDEDGTTVEPIPMRKEKRKTFLNLLQDNPGYWWIDVLCCRTDTPPVIMRGVYGCCHTCFAMIDCPSDAIEFLSGMLEPRTDSFLISTSTRAPKYARDIWECRWFSRVWTMQELALPSSVSFLSETCDIPCYLSADDLLSLLQVFRIKRQEFGEDEIGEDANKSADLGGHLVVLRVALRELHGDIDLDSFECFDMVVDLFAESERSCYFAQDYVYGALGMLGWDIPQLNNLEELWDRFLFSFQRFAEKLFWRTIRDFFHGPPSLVFGALYECCPETATKHCKETIRINISEEARSRTLSGACNMADMYQGLLYITAADCSCTDCRRIVEWLGDVSPFKSFAFK